MACEGRRRMRGAHLIVAALLVVIIGQTVTPAQASDNEILTVVQDAVYGGAAGLLLGGVLALVVPKDNRDDSLRWGVVVGTFAGFAYGMYDVFADGDSFSERVQARSEARRFAHRMAEDEEAIEAVRSAVLNGGAGPGLAAAACCPQARPSCGRIEIRPTPASSGAAERSAW